MLFTLAFRPSIFGPPHDWLACIRGSSFAEYSRPNCNAGWKGALMPIKRTGFRPDCKFKPYRIGINFRLTLSFYQILLEQHTNKIKYGGFT